jgi:hypothetical protein
MPRPIPMARDLTLRWPSQGTDHSWASTGLHRGHPYPTAGLGESEHGSSSRCNADSGSSRPGQLAKAIAINGVTSKQQSSDSRPTKPGQRDQNNQGPKITLSDIHEATDQASRERSAIAEGHHSSAVVVADGMDDRRYREASAIPPGFGLTTHRSAHLGVHCDSPQPVR